MEYFGRNLFVMNILQAKARRKLLNTSDLRAGNGEGPPPHPQIGVRLEKRGNVQEREKGMVRPEGVEPPTYWFVASCSIQLSYGRTLRGDATL
jgi:hypothetical protein